VGAFFLRLCRPVGHGGGPVDACEMEKSWTKQYVLVTGAQHAQIPSTDILHDWAIIGGTNHDGASTYMCGMPPVYRCTAPPLDACLQARLYQAALRTAAASTGGDIQIG